MSHVLEDVLAGRIVIENFKAWLTSDSLDNSVDKAEFISYFLNHVKEKCAWLTCRNGKSSESPFKQLRSNDGQQYSSTGQKSVRYEANIVNRTRHCDSILSSKKKTESCTKISVDSYFRNDASSKQPERIKKSGLSSSMEGKYSDSNWRNFEERNIRKADYSARKSLNFNNIKDARNKEASAPDINSFEAFPPVGSETNTRNTKDSKSRRRITPTPIQVVQNGSLKFRNSQFVVPTENVPNDVFKSTPFVETPGLDLQREREMLKITRDKILHSSPSNSFRNLKIENNFSPKKSIAVTFVVPDPEKVCHKNELLIFSVIYEALITNSLVPNVTSELYFIFEVITAKVLPEDKSNDADCMFSSIHNCIFFAVSVLSKLQNLLYLLGNSTLSYLCQIPYMSQFSSSLMNFLQEHCNEKEDMLTKSQLINRVPFHLEEDTRENFIDDQSFSSFRKQRDLFYELLRDWQDQPLGCIDTNFCEKFSRKAKSLISLGPNAVNMHHLAKLFQKQLIASCLGLEMNEVCDDLLSDMLKNFPGKIEKLRQRFMMPFCVGDPNPPPTFYGMQLFFRDLIDAAACSSLNQQLQDIFVCKIVDFNSADIFSDAELNPLGSVKEKYVFLLHTLRLLGKFLGYLYFLPYKVSVPLSPNIQNCQLISRKQTVPPIDVPKLLKAAIRKNRIILTVPWVVEYLSMVDPVGKKLPFIEETLRILGAIYRGKCCASAESMSFWFLRLMIGWLFDILCYSPEYYFLSQSVMFEISVEYKGIDLLAIIDKQLIHSCCPYLGEFKVLVYNFLNGTRSDKKREVRKITPLSTSKPLSTSVAKQQIQNQLEENFFFVHPPSMKKTVEFVAERIASKIINKVRSEVTDFKFQLVDKIIKQETYKTLLDSKPDIEKKLHSYVDSFILKQYSTFHLKIMDVVQTTCPKDIDTIMPYLFSEDIKPSVLKMCCKISVRIALDKILDWCDANLILEDITSDIRTQLNHLSKGDADSGRDNDYELSNLITKLRQCIMSIFSGTCDSMDDFILSVLSTIPSVIMKQIGSTSRKLIAFLTIDLYVAVIIHNSEMCNEEFNKSLVTIWSVCPKNYDLEKYFLGPQNIKRLLAGRNLERSCEKLNIVLNELISGNIFSADKLKECVKIVMSYEWQDSRAQYVFRHIANVLSSSSSKVT